MTIYILSKKYQTKWSIACDLCKRHYEILTSTLAFWRAHFCVHTCFNIKRNGTFFIIEKYCYNGVFLAHFSSVVRPSTFHILIFSSETTGPIATKLWWNDSWMTPFQNCVRHFIPPTKMATTAKLNLT
jgi:hypothetical protein